jgi:hypothetical protein
MPWATARSAKLTARSVEVVGGGEVARTEEGLFALAVGGNWVGRTGVVVVDEHHFHEVEARAARSAR